MADMTPDRLAKFRRVAAELRRIAAETTPGTYEWRIIETALALTIETALALLDRIEALEAKQQIGRNLSVAAEQLVKAWDMNAPREDLQFLIDDLRQALFEFEGPLGDGGTAWLSIDDNGEAGGATHA